MEHVEHTFEPVFDSTSRILILGTFPSVKSREGNFYYHHPQNRFWKVLSGLLDEPLPATVDEKKRMLLSRHIAIWDVIESCDIQGSSDSSIRNVVPADLARILDHAPVKQIYANGETAYKLYRKYCEESAKMPAVRLPSTSPANAAWSLERLTQAWSVMLENLTAGA
jgi:TDG/mug DNA glycosylase family protein